MYHVSAISLSIQYLQWNSGLSIYKSILPVVQYSFLFIRIYDLIPNTSVCGFYEYEWTKCYHIMKYHDIHERKLRYNTVTIVINTLKKENNPGMLHD